MRGQGLDSHGYHLMGKLVGDANLEQALKELKGGINKAVNAMPKHAEFLSQYGVKA